MVNYTDYIEIKAKVMMGKPVIRGTRLTVEMILEELSVGTPIVELVDAHQRLTIKAVYAALAFAADSLKGEKSYPIAV